MIIKYREREKRQKGDSMKGYAKKVTQTLLTGVIT
jgi:hypothetical protein